MKRLLSAFTFTVLSIVGFAQCTSCTISITGADAADHVISIGQVLCVQSTGTLTGRVYITSGGTLCNQGHINSRNIAVSSGGEFDNYGVAHIDTFYISSPSAVLNNHDTMSMDLFYSGAEATITNSGDISSMVYGDTATAFTNDGKFTISTNMYVGNTSTFINHRHLSVGGSFYCGPTANFTTTCEVPVLGDWYNSGTISGPQTGCGGFSITGQSFNSGTVGATGHVDICDAGHPASGFDGNSGITTGVTFCQCTDTCTDLLPSGIRDAGADQIDFSIYPNPASDRLQVLTTEGHAANITIQNAIGQTIYSGSMPEGARQLDINTSALTSGIYILTLESNGRRTSRRVEVVR